MAKYNKTQWRGGINQFSDPSGVDPATEYFLLINGRTRRDIVEPIYEPLDVTEGLPTTGTIQGVYPVGPYQVVFINGEAYYRNFDPESPTWTKIYGFQMSSTVAKIYLTTVPRSYVNFTRKAVSDTDAKMGVNLGLPGQPSPRCAIVMDGESQPWIIFPDATARRAKTYNEWGVNDREYVPAGCILPMYFGGILYCVGIDESGVYNVIYRSVTGRPLDFMVAVNAFGDKISSDEVIGGAPCVSFQPEFGQITLLAPSQTTQDAFVCCTANTTYLVIPTVTATSPYNEPSFSKQTLFPVGALNSECSTDVLADTAIIHYSGIRSFNAILNLKFEGKNAPFSRDIDGLIAGITQTYGAAVSFDNYSIFAVQTKYGPAIIWYDTLTERYASIDQFEGIGLIKQFSVILTRTARRLFFLTVDGRLYEYFGGEATAPVKVYVKDFTPQAGNAEHSISEVCAQLTPVLSAGYIQASIIVDGRVAVTRAQQLPASNVVDGDFIPVPYQLSSDGKPVNIPVKFGVAEAAFRGNRVGVLLEWTAQTSLRECVVETEEYSQPMPEMAKAYGVNIASVTPTTVFLLGDDGTLDAGRIALNRRIKSLSPDMVLGLGNHAYESGTDAQIAARLTAYWNNLRTLGKFYAVPGNVELDTDAGEPFFSAMRQPPTRYWHLATTWADFYMMNSGYNTDGTQIEPRNMDGPAIESSTQMLWLRDQLAVSTKHKIVLWHHSPWCSAASDDGGQLMRNIPLASWGATCHVGARPVYERLREDDLTWFVSGCGASDKLGSINTILGGSQARKTGSLGYLRFKIWPTLIESAFVDIDGNEFDNFLLHR